MTVEQNYLLIIGAPRSGTTLLASMIGRHSEVAMLNEDKGWTMTSIVGKKIAGNKKCVPNQIELKKRSFFTMRIFKTLRLIKEYQSSKYSIEDYLTLSNIKIIGLIRGGDDVVSSIMDRSKKSFRVASYRWARAVEIIYHLKNRQSEKVLVVSFEDLVLNPERNMKRVAAFLGIRFEDSMLEGPRYNPWYPEVGMNKEKVNRSAKQKIDLHLAERFPDVWQKYQELWRYQTDQGSSGQRC